MHLLWNTLGHILHATASAVAKAPSLDNRYGIKARLVGPWPKGPFLWLHGASLGESKMLAGLANALQEDIPQCQPILITVQKVEALQHLQQEFPQVTWALAPADTPKAVKTFMEQAQPTALVLGENELWPGYLSAMRKADKPVALVSGRYKSSAPATDLSAISFAAMQTRGDLARFASIAKTRRPTALVGGDWKMLPWARATAPHSATTRPSENCTERPIDTTFISIHKEEWPSISPIVETAMAHNQSVVLMPRRLEEADFFQGVISALGKGPLDWPSAQKGAVSLVRQFGLTHEILGQSRTAIVGGSFHKSLGVHDFWEPILMGASTLIGPYAKGKEDMASALIQSQVLAQIKHSHNFDAGFTPDTDRIRVFLDQERQKILDSYRQLVSFLSR